MAKKYQGHKSYNHWNVCLYIYNEEGLYRLACECRRRARTLDEAVASFMDALGTDAKTPDGVRYTKTTVRAALSNILEP